METKPETKAVEMKSKSLVERISIGLKEEIEKHSLDPHLCIIRGTDKSSETYTEMKAKKGEEIGIQTHLYDFQWGNGLERNVKQMQDLIFDLNRDSKYNGIMIQSPIEDKYGKRLNPEYMNRLFNTVNLHKDVDGLSDKNLENLKTGNSPYYIPATVKSMLEIAEEYRIELKDKTVSIINDTKLIGQPIYHLLEREGAKVNMIGKDTNREEKLDSIKNSDVIFTAVGNKDEYGNGFNIDKGIIKENAIIFDAGYNKINSINKNKGYEIIGDADKSVFEKASYITPPTGSVGPMTVTELMRNTVDAAKNRYGIEE